MPISVISVGRFYCHIALLVFILLFIGTIGCTKPKPVMESGQLLPIDTVPVNPAPTDTIPKDTIPKDTIKPPEALELLNEPYGVDSQQVMDIYLPAGRTPEATRIMVFIHGGGWMGSDKKDFTGNIDDMKNKNADYAYVNLNYRLVKDGKNIFPAAEEDINAALEYVWSKADTFHISKRTALVGNSSGAHLAALQACKHNQKGYIRAAVCVMGVYDMKRFHDEGSAGVAPLTVAVLGGTPDEKPDLYRSSSPVYYASRQCAPTLLIHGSLDTLARYGQAVTMNGALKKAGVVHQLYSFKGYHAIPGENVNEAAARMFSFMEKYTK